jgi:Tol biopolymer transport system component
MHNSTLTYRRLRSSLALPAALALVAPAARPNDLVRASVTSAGLEGHGNSFEAAVSGDGRVVAFASYASDLVPGDGNGAVDVFVHDLVSGQTTRVSVATGGGEAHGESRGPALSFDGRFVAFDSNAPDLVPGDDNGSRDIFVHDRTTQETTRVSVTSGGAQAFGDCFDPDLSDDGRYVAFYSFADDLVPTDGEGFADVFVRDRTAGTTVRVSQTPLGAGGNSNSHSARISGDGVTVVFASSADNLVAGARAQDILAWSRLTGLLALVSVNNGGVAGDGSSYLPDVSADGRFVVFESESLNLVPDDRQGFRDVFLRDRAESTTIRLSDPPGPDEADGASRHARLSGDGRFVVFESAAINLVAGDSNNRWDVYLADLALGSLARLSVTRGGAQVNHDSLWPALSAGGSRVAFESASPALVPSDGNGSDDVFVVLRPGAATAAFCIGSSAACPCANAGDIGHGCENSIPTGGGLLSAVGTASVAADTLRLDATHLPPGTTIVFFQGSAPTLPAPFGDGLTCVGGGIRRLAPVIATGGIASIGFGVPATPQISVQGTVPPEGGARYYQGWYRNAAAFCTAATSNMTNGLRIDWQP